MRHEAENTVEDDPERSLELLWGGRARARRGPKAGLSLELITLAAIEIADADGLARLSMPHLAAHLGSGTMSLYRHVPGKAQLIDVMLDAVVGEPPAPDTVPGASSGRLERWAEASAEIFRRHPWALQVVTNRRVMGPNQLAWFEAALEAVSGIGLSDREMVDVVFLVDGYVRGAAQAWADAAQAERRTGVAERAWVSTYARIMERVTDERRYPALTGILASGALDTPPDFTFGLRRVLDGIATLVARDVAQTEAKPGPRHARETPLTS